MKIAAELNRIEKIMVEIEEKLEGTGGLIMRVDRLEDLE